MTIRPKKVIAPSILIVILLLIQTLITGGDLMAADESKFVTVQGSKLMLGNREFYAKGATYFGGRYIDRYEFDGNLENVNNWQFLTNINFNAQAIEQELAFQKTQLGINCIRIITPSYATWENGVLYQGWAPWFLSDGAINPIYLSEIQQILAICKKYGIKVQIALIYSAAAEIKSTALIPPNNVTSYGPISPGSTGTAKESFYRRYLESLIPVLKDDPTILSYTIDQESILDSNINYVDVHGGNDFAGHVLSFQKRMIGLIRSLDQNHLIMSGEVAGASGFWWSPSPEYALIPDVDNLNGGQPFSLGSLIDCYNPHLYSNDPNTLSTITQELRAGTSKPVFLGEMGYMPSPICNYDPQSQNAGPQLDNARATLEAVWNSGLNGAMVFEPFPQFKLEEGRYTHHPNPNGYAGECDYAEYTPSDGSPVRKLRSVFPTTWQYFSCGDLTPLPAAGYFQQAYMSKMLNDAQLVSMNVPTSAIVGQPFPATVVMRNTGTKPWVRTGNSQTTHQLIDHAWAVSGSNVVWSIGGEDLRDATIMPGQEASFDLTVYPPSTPGNYPFAMQMLQQGIEFFGDITPNVNITVNPVGSNQAPSVTLTLPSNSQSFTAPASIAIQASASDADGSISKVEFYQGSTLLKSDTTNPYTYNWTNVPQGTYTLTAKAVDDQGLSTTSSPITVTVLKAGTDGATFISQSVPSTMIAGQSYTVSITMQNSGTTNWSPVGPQLGAYRLGSTNPNDNPNGNVTWGVYRADLPTTVSSGSPVTVNFNITAPTAPGSYSFQWQMLLEGTNWFGDRSPNTEVNVVALQNNATFISQNIPATMIVGQTYPISITLQNSGTSTWMDPFTCISTDCGYRLGSQDPADNNIWGMSRVSVAGGVAPGQSKTFNFNVTAPTAPGAYNFQWQMVQEWIEWFGAKTPNVVVGIVSPSANQSPTVNAGSDQAITLPVSASLNGTASDDGLPSGSALTTTWSKLSGPGSVAFANVNAIATTATFSASGSYILRLTASDGTLFSSDDVAITVNAPSSSNPIGFWMLDEASGSAVFVDSSGNGANGGCGYSCPGMGNSGKIGSSASFDGSSKSIQIPYSASNALFQLNQSKPFTLAAWIHPNASLDGYRGIIGTDYNQSWLLSGGDNSNSIGFYIQGTRTSTSVNSISLNTWTHVAATFDGTTKSIYINGVLSAQANVSGINMSSTSPIQIGTNSSGASFSGLIDDVRVYNRTLTLSEIQAMSNVVSDNQPPAVSLTASVLSVAPGGSFTLGWSSTNAANCIASGGWSGAKPTMGSETIAPNSSSTYTLTCSDSSGQTATKSIAISVASAADTTPPTVNITNPSNGQTVRGTVTIAASATDDRSAIKVVSFKIDKGTAKNDTTAPYSISWKTSSVSVGVHTITVTATDTAGNQSSSVVTVTVRR